MGRVHSGLSGGGLHSRVTQYLWKTNARYCVVLDFDAMKDGLKTRNFIVHLTSRDYDVHAAVLLSYMLLLDCVDTFQGLLVRCVRVDGPDRQTWFIFVSCVARTFSPRLMMSSTSSRVVTGISERSCAGEREEEKGGEQRSSGVCTLFY